MNLRKSLFWLLTLVSFYSSYCQKNIVIIDSLTKKPIPFAKIKVEGGKELETKFDGSITLNEKINFIEISNEGYHSTKTHSLYYNDTILLHPNVTFLEEVVISVALNKRKYKTGYLKGKDVRFKLKDGYEIGCYIPNTFGSEQLSLKRVFIDLAKENDSYSLKLNIYKAKDGIPDTLIYTTGDIEENKIKSISIFEEIFFPKEGLFCAIEINFKNKKSDGPYLLLTKEYYKSQSFIRGAIYGVNWVELSRLNFRNVYELNACISLELANY